MRHRLLAVPAAAVIVLATALPALAFGTTPDASYGTGGTVSLPNGSDGVTLVQHGALTYDAYSFFATNIRTVLERRDSTGALDPVDPYRVRVQLDFGWSVEDAVWLTLFRFVHCLISSPKFGYASVASTVPCHSCMRGYAPVYPGSMSRASVPHC